MNCFTFFLFPPLSSPFLPFLPRSTTFLSFPSLSTSFHHFPLLSCPFQSFGGKVNARTELKDKRGGNTKTRARKHLFYIYISYVCAPLDKLSNALLMLFHCFKPGRRRGVDPGACLYTGINQVVARGADPGACLYTGVNREGGVCTKLKMKCKLMRPLLSLFTSYTR